MIESEEKKEKEVVTIEHTPLKNYIKILLGHGPKESSMTERERSIEMYKGINDIIYMDPYMLMKTIRLLNELEFKENFDRKKLPSKILFNKYIDNYMDKNIDDLKNKDKGLNKEEYILKQKITIFRYMNKLILALNV